MTLPKVLELKFIIIHINGRADINGHFFLYFNKSRSQSLKLHYLTGKAPAADAASKDSSIAASEQATKSMQDPLPMHPSISAILASP